MGRVTGRRPVVRLTGATSLSRPDTLVVEEPLEIRIDGTALAVTMRTPGDDLDLAHGFLATEGVIATAADVLGARYCDGTDDEGRTTYNVLDLSLAPGVAAPGPGTQRNFTMTSACGVCGKASIDAVRTVSRHRVDRDDTVVGREVLVGLPERMRSGQAVFERTGGLHAAGLFSTDGELLCLREDVGRHNAVDKVLGWALREGRLPLTRTVLLVSARASFELTQKAVMAGVPVLAAVSAPSTLAVDLAEEAGLTLVGFLRGDTMNLYTRPERVAR